MLRKSALYGLAGVCSLLFLSPLLASPATLAPSLAGFSGKLRAIFVSSEEAGPARMPWTEQREPLDAVSGDFLRFALKPFSAKVDGRIGSYRLGTWPYEGRPAPDPLYASPTGFVEVTPENLQSRVSEHFTLGEFLTKDQDQRAVWPKYLVLDSRLLDKLELTIGELSAGGRPVADLVVMSGFRTPDYNRQGVGAGGRSSASRHQYGDAADVYPDDDGTGQMDDLNGDGRVDLQDARVLAEAAEAVERRHPDLVGGIGVYPATDAHGPFVHIDVRGRKARWNG